MSRIKFTFFILCLAFIMPQAVSANRIIYGNDDRLDYSEASKAQQGLADSVVSIWRKAKIKTFAGDNAHYYLETEPLSESPFKVCSEEKFSNQLSGAFCSGSLVGTDLVLTAGHCTLKYECRDTAVVFGFNENLVKQNASKAVVRDGHTYLPVPRENVYYCSSYPAKFPEDYDIAVMKLNSSVSGRRALVVDGNHLVQVGESVFTIGHPLGSTLKVAGNAGVRFVSYEEPEIFFAADLDTFAGNSGSPVFNTVSKKIIGVLTEGGNDFVPSESGCSNYNVLAADARGGEIIRFVKPALKFLPADKAATGAVNAANRTSAGVRAVSIPSVPVQRNNFKKPVPAINFDGF